MNSPLKWAGSKRWHVEELSVWFRAIGSDRRLVEPFCGGLNIALGLEPKHALLNDVNEPLMGFWRCLQKGLPIVEYGRDYLRPESYFILRATFNQLVREDYAHTVACAGYFYALNHWAFNGLYRVNSKGEFNVPPRPEMRPLPDLDVPALARALEGWELACGDWQELETRPDDFIYADPPYDDGFTGYSAGKFSWEDQQRLAKWLAFHPGPVVAMNKATNRIQELYHNLGFSIELIDAPQRMHHAMGQGGEVLEMMATKP